MSEYLWSMKKYGLSTKCLLFVFQSSEEEAPPTASKKTPAEDHNMSRSMVVNNMKVLIGQTPKGIRL